MTRRTLLFLVLCLLLPSLARSAGLPSGLRALLAAYPDKLCGARPDALLWCDGTVIPWDDGRPDKDPEELLNGADLEDQFRTPYPAGPRYPSPPPPGFDPGRIRHEPFFRKMYGADRAAVEGNLVPVEWPFGRGKTVLLVSRVNGVDRKVKEVIRDLAGLPPSFREILAEPAAAYNWRPIAGTGRLSLHSFGIAIDLGGRFSDYWLWDAQRNGGRFPWRNRIPWEIVEIFERHGFIWGGKWHHYDTMHFEYRPELLPHGP